MFEFITFCGLVLLAFGALALVAFPDALIKDPAAKKITVGGTYWGAYTDAKESQDGKTIEVTRRFSHPKSLAGSTSYSSGKGTG